MGTPLPRTLRKGSKNAEKQTNSELSQLLEEISKLLEAYSQAILNSDS